MMDLELEESGDPVETEDQGPSSSYLSSYHGHVESTLQHLRGFSASSPLPSSGMDRITYWTTSEKDLFFHALSVHSRLRPDLISAEVGTKNLMEVTAYIDTLEDALAEEKAPHGAFVLESSVVDGEEEWEDVPRTERDAFPYAIEVSEEWCRYEEQQAAMLSMLEPAFRLRATHRARDQLVEAQRSVLRKRRASSGERGRDRKGEKERKKELEVWVQEKQREWKLQEFTSCLDGFTLAAMDTVLREDDDERLFKPLPADSSANPTPQAGPSTFSTNTHSREMTPLGSSVSESSKTTVPPEELSPASRRRLYKRMYMRRKRAEKAQRDLDGTLARLKPGRKAKAVAPVADIGAEEEEEHDAERSHRHPHKSGLTLPYRIRAEVEEMGIGAEWMRNEGLDLLRLSNCHKLMRTYNELHGAEADVVSSISAEVLANLQAHVVQFVRRVVKKACLSRSFERQTKARTKVWRISERPIIRKKNVKHALGMYVGKNLCKRRHFRRLRKRVVMERVRQPAVYFDGESADGTEDEEIEVARLGRVIFKPLQPTTAPLTFECPSDLSKKRMPLPIRHLSTLRTVLPPDVYPPCEWEAEVDPTRQGLLESRRETDEWPTPWGEPGKMRDDVCLESETDEEAMDAEMEEEEELDLREEAAAKGMEAMLWEAEGTEVPEPLILSDISVTTGSRKRQRDDEQAEDEDEKSGSEYEDEDESQAAPTLKRFKVDKRVTGQQKKYKSREYISDSDID